MLLEQLFSGKIRSKRNEIAEYGIRAIGLFGSYIRDEQSQTSDIDILIDFEAEQENFDNFLAVCEIFERLFSKKKVEIVTKNGLSPYIGPKILKEVQYV